MNQPEPSLFLPRYTKLAADGAELTADATDHESVRVDHPMLSTPLLWLAKRAPREMTWEKAKAWAEKQTIQGQPCRLPTVDEAYCLCDRSKFPAVPKGTFPDQKQYEWIWTGTVDAEDPSAPAGVAWLVGLDDGSVSRNHQDDRSFVRAVRAGQ